MKKRAVIVGNGERPPKKIWDSFLSKDIYKVSADGGLKHFAHFKYSPDIIIGDFDSVDGGLLDRYKTTADIVRIDRQNDTDLEKALKYVLKQKYKDIVILGGTGGRLDHSIANLGLLVKYHTKAVIRIINNTSIVQAYSSYCSMPAVVSECFSLYGIAGLPKVSTRGLQYALLDKVLSFGGFESTSNAASKPLVQIDISGGTILVVRGIKSYMKVMSNS